MEVHSRVEWKCIPEWNIYVELPYDTMKAPRVLSEAIPHEANLSLQLLTCSRLQKMGNDRRDRC